MEENISRLRIISRTLSGILLAFFVFIFAMIFSMVMFSIFPGLINLSWIMGFLSQTGFLIVSMILIFIFSKGRLSEFGFGLPAGKKWLIWIPVSLIIGFISCLIIIFSPAKGFPDSGGSSALGSSVLQMILLVWIQASICEEVTYRSAIQGFLKPLMNYGIYIRKLFLSIPVITSGILFGIMHVFLVTIGMDNLSVVIIMLNGIVLGLIAGYQREKTGSLIPAIIIHACFNIGGSVLSFLPQAMFK